MARQRCFLSAMADQLDPVSAIRNFGSLAKTIETNVRTDIPLNRLPSLVRLVSSVDSSETLTVTFGFDYFFGRQKTGNYPVPKLGRIQTTVRQAILTPELLQRHGQGEDGEAELLADLIGCMDVESGSRRQELQARRERLLEHVRGLGLSGFALFGADYIRYFTNFNFLATERPVAVVGNTTGDLGGVRPRVRGRACPGGDLVRAGRVLSGVPGDGASDAAPRRRAARARGHRPDRRRRGRLSGHPRLRRPGAERDDRAARDAARAVHREPDGAEERGRGGADPRERALVRARAPAAAGVLAAGRDGGRGRPTGGPRGDAGAAGDARRLVRRAAGLVRRRLGGLPRPDRAAQLVGARGRPQHPTSRRATSSSPRRPRRSGATTPSSSAR